ncbi:MAG: Uma2 family endonuclease, partial [Anaerolineae bacterium]|nr:Uma2 family endonuclease [Anaerolineae bacterium]
MTIGEQVKEAKIVATDIPLEQFYKDYEGHYEWVGGMVFEMPPVLLEHNDMQEYLGDLLKVYFSFRPIGKITKDPFPMHMEGISDRQPDIQVILGDNQQNLTAKYMDGAADIVIEIVSPGSAAMDRGRKFEEYQRGCVPEYWIIDPQAEEALFYRLDEKGVFKA